MEMYAHYQDLWKEVEHVARPSVELPNVREGRLRTMLAEEEFEFAKKERGFV